jgi:hypothetical protein
MWEPGLPAIQAPRCVRHTAVMLSQASQLPQKLAPTVLIGFTTSDHTAHQLLAVTKRQVVHQFRQR